MVHERERRAAAGEGPLPHPAMLFAKCTALGAAVFSAVYALSSVIAGVGLGWITALQGSSKIINWLSLPTILAHMTTWVTPLRLESVLNVTRPICWAALAATLVWTWWRFRRTEREAAAGIVITLVAIVLLSPAALPWYYSWPLAIGAGFALSLTTLQVLVGLCTWLMLVFEPDGNPAMYKFWHVAAAVFAAVVAALSLRYVDPLRLRARPKAVPPVGAADVLEPDIGNADAVITDIAESDVAATS
jgi:alpha-1,6-mannosyltransferase